MIDDDRFCTWLSRSGGRVVWVPRSTWWLALTRSPVARRYRSRLSPSSAVIRRACRTEKRHRPLA
jgi:hypothetical protein